MECSCTNGSETVIAFPGDLDEYACNVAAESLSSKEV